MNTCDTNTVARHEDAFYEVATNELSDDWLAPAIWGRALSETSGDSPKATARYIQLRVEQLARLFEESPDEFKLQLWPNVTAGKAFLCPSCQRASKARAIAIDADFILSLFGVSTGSKKYYCQVCNQEIKPPQLLPIQNLVARALEMNASITEKHNNPIALSGFIVGIVGLILHVIGIIPIVGVVLSAIGLASFKPATQNNKWMAGWGLGLSILGTVSYLTGYGHIR